jgi:uncharacterized glyoxalase superfamily protein PhnB
MSAASATIIPCLGYGDAKAAIEWLCTVVGFEKRAVYEGPNDTIAHAELTFGNGMIMLGSSSNEGPFARLLVHPGDIDGKQTQAPYVIVPDADALYARVKTSGAEILIDIKTEDYGGRGFTCRDPEGHVWTFGTYDPWAVSPPSKGEARGGID